MNNTEEQVIIVDEHNNEKAVAPRSEMRLNNLIHRASYIIVCNSAGEIFVQKRTRTKDIYPGYYDIAAGGVVQENETYLESAKRELQEELGVSAFLKILFDHFYCDAHNKVWGRIFSCIHEGPFQLQKEEVESGHFMPVHEVLQAREMYFTPDGIEILEKIMRFNLLPGQ